MSFKSTRVQRVLAIDPTSRGFGFAILEGPEYLIDWGVKEARQNKESRCLKQIDHLISHYRPEVIVVEDCGGKGSRRILRVQRLIEKVIRLASEKKIKTYAVSQLQVREVFSLFGAGTKHEIAMAIGKQFPELAPRLPPYRKSYMSEDYRMSIFDAVAFALTYVHSHEKRELADRLSNF